MKNSICVLIACHNRRDKTLSCLRSIEENKEEFLQVDILLLDDGSTDGTREFVTRLFPHVQIHQGDGSFYWAGAMRHIWRFAQKTAYDFYLLLNDDTILEQDAISELLRTHKYSLEKYNSPGIYIGSTKDPITRTFSYGGRRFVNSLTPHSRIVYPNMEFPQIVDLGNANVMMVSRAVVETIGIFDEAFTHGIADYEYTFRARKAGIPVLITANYCGTCIDDHGVNWKPINTPLKERIKYLKSPKGLSYREYLQYVKMVRRRYTPIAFFLLWAKTLCPLAWSLLKKRN